MLRRLPLPALVLFGCSTSLPPPGEQAGPDGGAPPSSHADAGPSSIPDGGAAEPLSDPAQPGKWPVGVRTVELTDPARGRSFSVDIWYPAMPDGKSNTYRLESVFGSLLSIETPARRDATVAPGGPWPLILFSHGFGGVRFQSYFLTEHLASHGFVVAAPDHPGNTLLDTVLGGGDAAQSALDRPLDLLYALDHLLGGDPIPIDATRIAATGHSFGGWTALEVARRDDRIGALFPMAPGFKNGATPDFVAELARPLLVFGGSEDGTTPFDSDQQAPYELAAPPKHLVRVEGAGHLDFSNLCEVPVAPLLVDDGCDPSSIDPAAVHARVNTLATAFALHYLTEQPDYAAYLAPDAVHALDHLTYWHQP
jgi:predicted dienelactone hydrolase